MSKKITTKEWIKKARKVHGDTYDYSLVEYRRARDDVKIICNIHGEFFVTPNNHISKKSGCPLCGRIKSSSSNKRDTNEFIIDAKKVHGDKYIYTNTEYKSVKGKVIIDCRKHGSFKQTATDHLSGKGCPKCSKNSRKDLKYFLDSAKKVHGNKYDYSKVNFKTMSGKVKIVCEKHGVYMKSPTKHLMGQGCPSCTKYGFNPKTPAILYYLKVVVGENVAYKIGITNNTVGERYYASDRENFEVLMRMDFRHGADARAEEKKILKEFKSEKWDGVDLLKSGNTELFKTDVLGLDK